MHPYRSLLSGSGLLKIYSSLFLLGTMILVAPGCDGMPGKEPAKTAAALETEQKVEALAKEGKSLREIRAIMKGEPLPKKGKKTARKP